MKKIVLSFIASLLMFGGGSLAYAETGINTNSGTPRPGAMIKNIIKNAKEEMKDLKDRKASSTEEKVERIKEKVENRFKKMTARFQATIEREESMMARIVSRIEKIKTAGGKTEVSEKFISDAKVHLEKAKASLASMLTNTQATATSEINASTTETRKLAKNALISLQKVVKEAEGHIREAHALLVKAVTNLKGMSSENKKMERNATSTDNVKQ